MPHGPERLERFIAAAQEFCSLVEAAPKLDRQDFLKQIYPSLIELLQRGARLEMAPPTGNEKTGASRTTEEWSSTFELLREKLGDQANYYECFDPREEESGMASLADDLADIYWDLKEGIEDLQEGTPIVDVEFDWRLGFETHWGLHAVDALRAIHHLHVSW